ncbi:hypothetical protein BJP36_29200 [Moorena producens JHB]|uniref:SnoaL-like domain-containing protein n=2 Tax=Cyanophyceae TaxID=3028117 RepID=A0A1D9G6W2_MOOP1|nr:hypothetical protein [Moorena producens]AAS98792.1 hypothetical protein [Lyngbya majuscula]AOY83389.1 hypothetical protein BJP36_29200 [Moorena producens JHB]
MTTPEENLKIVQDFFEVMMNGTPWAENPSVSKDIECYYSLSKDSIFCGKVNGVEEMDRYLKVIFEKMNDSKFDSHYNNWVAYGNLVMCTAWERVFWRVEEGLVEHMVDYNMVFVITLDENGLIVKFEELMQTALDGMFNIKIPPAPSS